MNLPEAVRDEVEARFGPLEVLGAVGGGCIQPALHITAGESDLFLKFGRQTPAGFFVAEAECLRQLRAATGHLRVPEVAGSADTEDGRAYGWIVMEWLEPGRPGAEFSARLAAGLSELHAPGKREWGWEVDGFIGTLAQENRATEHWPEFWRRRRLEPQLELARRSGRLPGREGEWVRLLERLPQLLSAGDEDGPSLLHGDLWGGNILATSAGEPAIVDPAAYRGHREVDLAMSELFGGVDPRFYREYEDRRPLHPGYRECRRGIYQLYYLLVHVNLFGDAYVARTTATLRSVLSSL